MMTEPKQKVTFAANGLAHRTFLSVDGIVTAIVLIGLIGYFLSFVFRYIDMFLLIEYRQWVFGSEQASLIDPRGLLHLYDLGAFSGSFQLAFSRSFSLWTAAVFGRVCGFSPVCHNSLHVALLLASAAFVAMTSRTLSLSRSWFPPVAGIVSILISVPVLDAMTWQATLLDKLAMLLTTITIFIAARIDIKNTATRHVIFVNLIFLVVVFCAYNSKEASFFLVPATVLLLLIRIWGAEKHPGIAIRQSLGFTAAPIVYAGMHLGLVIYNRIYINPGEMSRVTGGNIAFNVEFYARYILNQLGEGHRTPELILVAAVIAALVVTSIIADLTRRGDRRFSLSAWAFLGFVGSLIIPLRTSSTSPFYLLVPMVYFGLLIAFALDSIMVRLNRQLSDVFVMICTASLFFRAAMIQEAIPLFDHLEILSTNFQQTLATVRSEIMAGPFDRLVFIRPEEQRSYMYVSSQADDGDYALAPYLAPAGATYAELKQLEGKIKDVPLSQATAVRQPGNIVVTLDPTLKVERIEKIPR